jgi:hypothetical protein
MDGRRAGEETGGGAKAILTLAGRLDTVRRFREYPERAVFKRLGGLWLAYHWIQEIQRRVRQDG